MSEQIHNPVQIHDPGAGDRAAEYVHPARSGWGLNNGV